MQLLPSHKDLGWKPFAWIIYIAFFVVFPVLKPHTTPLEWAATIAATLLFLVLYFRGYWARDRELVFIVVAMTALGVAFFPSNGGGGSFYIYAASFAAWMQPRRRAIWAIAAIEAVVIAQTLALRIHPFYAFWPVVFTIIVGALNLQEQLDHAANARLRLAHDEIAHLAQVAERERIARDLHDLLGHTLSLIILKSELASKLADRDVDRARNEIRDVERISRDALAQVRNAVRGYRSSGLAEEVEAARRTLTTAGVTTEVALAQVALTPAHEVVIALAIREAATNIVRHAAATQCRIAIEQRDDSYVVTIADDGHGGNQPFGDGLSGMRERVEALGGTMTRDGARGTTLTISFPAQRVALGVSA
jgi:two-component system sensor histidine kinase DesK